MPQIHTLRVVNETDETVTICVYQTSKTPCRWRGSSMPSPPADRFTDSEVLDVPSLEKKLRIDFPQNVFAMTVVIEADGEWKLIRGVEGP